MIGLVANFLLGSFLNSLALLKCWRLLRGRFGVGLASGWFSGWFGLMAPFLKVNSSSRKDFRQRISILGKNSQNVELAIFENFWELNQ